MSSHIKLGKLKIVLISVYFCIFLQLVRFYSRIGFKAVREVTGSTMGDLADMLVWGGVGTRMDANIEDLLLKWCSRFKPRD